MQHFEELFRANDQIGTHPVLKKIQLMISEPLQLMLEESYSKEEIVEVINQMHPEPPPDLMVCVLYSIRNFGKLLAMIRLKK